MTAPVLITSLDFVIGDPARHITIVDAATGAQIGPTGVTFSSQGIVSLTPDATGFSVAPVAVGGVPLNIGFPGDNGTTLNVTVAPKVQLGVTSP